MSAIFANRPARRRAVGYLSVLIASLLMLAASASPVILNLQQGLGFAFRPVQSALDGFGHDLSSIATAVGEIDTLRTENESLRAENDRIQQQVRQAEEIRRQNDLLTGLLQLRNGLDYSTVAAAVIARESLEVQQRVTLDRGTDDGIIVGDVVIAAGGALVGRVVDVRPSSSIVQLISDSGSTVIGQLLTSAATGEVTGQLPNSLIMRNIDAATAVGLGEEVVTAGIELSGGIRSPYPKGLVIGRIIDVRRDANEVVQTAFVEPAVTLDRLEFVLVILDYQGGLPAPEEQPTTCRPNADGTIPGGEQPCIEPSPKPSP
ncbi:MAG: rod shape-determining protein MreC [Chloroflexi bacterium]|nr:rod shape-determining protein MreC [Chloroflexota bacterium]